MKDLRRNIQYQAERPYEKCLLYGPGALTDAELLAVIIRTGTAGRPVLELAEQLLGGSGKIAGLTGICRMSIPELMQLKGIGQVKAVQLKCVGELSVRIAAGKARPEIRMNDPGSIAEYFMERLRHAETEMLYAMMFDTRNHLLGEECLSKGTVRSTVLSVREIFLAALRYRAVQFVLVHNHPSGDPTPSEDDLTLTKNVAEAGTLMEIRLLDHIIIGDRCYISLFENLDFLRVQDAPS